MSDSMKAQVQNLAVLARLELTPKEVETYSEQLSKVLSYVEQLKSVNVTQNGKPVEPLFHPFEMHTTLRKDEVIPTLKNASGSPKILESAPDALYDGYKVPPIL